MNKKKIMVLIILFIFLIAPIIYNSIFAFNSVNKSQGNNNNDFNNDGFNKGREIKISEPISEETWWNESFQWRHPIIITNPYNIDLIDYMTYIRINHTAFVESGKIQDDLGDIRVVENGQLRNYYFKTLYPSGDYAYIWFEIDIIANSIESDTYLYYGNSEISPSPSYYKPERVGTHWWGFEEGSGSSTEDRVGNIDGTLNNFDSNDWTVGQIEEYCLNFDSIDNEYIQLESDPLTSGQFSISLWFNANNSQGTIFDMSQDPSYLYISLRSDSIDWHYEDSNDADIQISYDFPYSPTNQWYHVVATGGWNSGLHQLWINGELKSQSTRTLSNKPSFANPRIGAYTDTYASPNTYYDGKIDDIRIYDFQIDRDDMIWLFTNYTLETNLLNQEERTAKIQLTVRDIDDRPVPDAQISLINYTAPSPNRTVNVVNTNEKGVANFGGIKFGEYNFSIKYSLNNGSYTYEEVLYNSSNIENGTLIIQDLTYNKTLNVNIWSIDFEVDDWEMQPIDYGYVLVYYSFNTPLLTNITLNLGTGLSTFRWLNKSDYYYEVYYQNADYSKTNYLITSNIITRRNKLNMSRYYLNQSSLLLGNNNYLREVIIYANDSNSTYIGKNTIISVDISLEDIKDHLNSFSIEYWASDKTWKIINEASKIYSSSDTSDIIRIDMFEDFLSFGFKIKVNFFNISQSNGFIDINYTQTTHEYIRVNMSKLRIYTLDQSEERQPIENMIVRVQNGTNGVFIVNLTTDDTGEAKGNINNLPFWFFHDNYNFTLSFFNASKPFTVSQSDEYYEPYQIEAYNYTLDDAFTLIFNVSLTLENYKSRFQNVSSSGDVIWEEIMKFSVNYTVKEPNQDWTPIQNPDYVKYMIKELGTIKILKSGDLADLGNGNFSISINSSDFIAGKSYLMTIYGHKIGYVDPMDQKFQFIIKIRKILVDFYNYTSKEVLTTNKIPEYYGELINISLTYNDTIKSIILEEKLLTYSWNYGNGSVLMDPLSNKYYYILINTSLVSDIGEYNIQIAAQLQYNSNINVLNRNFTLKIINRPTLLNGTLNILYLSKELYILDSYNFTFNYVDLLKGTRISQSDEATYILNKLDENFNPIPGETSSGRLYETSQENYILDLDTEILELGVYSVTISFVKKNYESKVSKMTLVINKRIFNYFLSTSTKFSIESGAPLYINIRLNDPNNNSNPVINAEIYFMLNGNQFNFEDKMNGIYELQVSKISEPFFLAEIINPDIYIIKENFITEKIELTILIEMKEIFPGFPTFFLILIIISSIAVGGSISTYIYIKKKLKLNTNIKNEERV